MVEQVKSVYAITCGQRYNRSRSILAEDIRQFSFIFHN
jgi:hypothetical protein